MPRDILPRSLLQNYEVHEWRHATAVLAMDFPEELKDIIKVLGAFTLKRSAIIVGGGGKSKVAQEIDSGFYKRGWAERHFDTKITVGDESRASPTHSVDCFKNGIALEIEWSNKDPFFDRDLNNFRLLFDLRVASVGVIITKSDELRSTLTDLGIWSKYGTSTTWMHKLLPRIEGGGGGGCPLLVFGITNRLYRADQ
jgi:hypothetical protein